MVLILYGMFMLLVLYMDSMQSYVGEVMGFDMSYFIMQYLFLVKIVDVEVYQEDVVLWQVFDVNLV